MRKTRAKTPAKRIAAPSPPHSRPHIGRVVFDFGREGDLPRFPRITVGVQITGCDHVPSILEVKLFIQWVRHHAARSPFSLKDSFLFFALATLCLLFKKSGRHTHEKSGMSILCQEPNWAAQIVVYYAPSTLLATAVLYLIAAILDYFGDIDYKIVYIAAAGMWVLGQGLIMTSMPVIRNMACANSAIALDSDN